jgi:hypothetical protein
VNLRPEAEVALAAVEVGVFAAAVCVVSAIGAS